MKKPYKVITLLLCCISIFSLSSWISAVKKQEKSGQELYMKYCIRCHGANGTKHFLGAKDLQISKLDDNAITLIIQNGKSFMPSFKDKLLIEEKNKLIVYVKTLRK
jgi:mono/diheme cytochrome c family protein